jgi:hypothetical protein
LAVFYARAYDPVTGTFTAPDPIGVALDTLVSLNLYVYAGGNPATFVDVLGYWPDFIDDIGDALGSAAKTVGKGVKAAGKWVGEHKREIAGAAVGLAVAACVVATAGVCGVVGAGMGAAATFVAAGAAGAAASYAITGDNGKYSAAGAAKAVAIGGVLGAAGPVAGKLGGQAIQKTIPLVTKGTTKATQTIKTGVRATTKPGVTATTPGNTAKTTATHNTQWRESLASPKASSAPSRPPSSPASTRSNIAKNKAAGDAARDRVARQIPGSEREKFYKTTKGPRFVDVFDPRTRLAREVKVGKTGLTKRTKRQAEKDIELRAGGDIKGAEWDFARSPTTGLRGPTKPLEQFLNKNKIGIRYV